MLKKEQRAKLPDLVIEEIMSENRRRYGSDHPAENSGTDGQIDRNTQE